MLVKVTVGDALITMKDLGFEPMGIMKIVINGVPMEVSFSGFVGEGEAMAKLRIEVEEITINERWYLERKMGTG